MSSTEWIFQRKKVCRIRPADFFKKTPHVTYSTILSKYMDDVNKTFPPEQTPGSDFLINHGISEIFFKKI